MCNGRIEGNLSEDAGSFISKPHTRTHIPIIITTQNQTQRTRRRKVPRRFEEKWASNPQCETVIQEAWRVAVRNGSPLSKLFEKIKRFKFSLVDWSHASGASSKTLLQEKQK